MSAILLPNGRVATQGAAHPNLSDPAGIRRFAGLLVVIAVHALIGWAMASGLAREVIEVIRKPIQTTLIPEIAPVPPPPPPKVERVKERPKAELPPPPAYVPPPEVVPEVVPPAPVIVAVQAEPPKEPAVIAPPPAPDPKPAVVKQEISLACPGYQNVLEQVLADAFERVGIVGAVRTRITVRGSQVVDAVPQSGPKEYYKYVQTAVKRMRCSAGGAEEVQVMLDVLFRR